MGHLQENVLNKKDYFQIQKTTRNQKKITRSLNLISSDS